MPCLSHTSRDVEHWREEQQHARTRRTAANLEAALCAVLTVLEQREELTSVVNAIDCAVSGLTPKKILAWFADHKKKDKMRKQKEALARKEEAKLASTVKEVQALSKTERARLRKALNTLKE